MLKCSAKFHDRQEKDYRNSVGRHKSDSNRTDKKSDLKTAEESEQDDSSVIKYFRMIVVVH